MKSQKFPKNTFIGSSYLFLFACFLFIKAKPTDFPDSVRYFLGNSDSVWQEIIAHTGRNVQTILFTLGANLTGNRITGPMIMNLGVWFLAATLLLFFLEKNLKNSKTRFAYMVFSVLVFTSYIVATWMSCVLSESIALSFLIPLIVIATLTIFGEVEIETSKNWILTNHLLLFLSQPIWAVIALPLTVFAFENIRKYLKQMIALGATAAICMLIATASHALPYENTGLTYKGFESLTRAYFYSLNGRFGEVALGENIKNCKPAYDLLLESETKGSPYLLFVGFKEASANCPELVAEYNAGKTNSIPKMLTYEFKRTAVMTVVGLYAIGNQRAEIVDTLSNRSIGALSTDLLIPFGLFLAPASLLLVKSKRQKIYLSASMLTAVLGGLALYFQVGIEGERHSLPSAITLSLITWLIVINYFRNSRTVS